MQKKVTVIALVLIVAILAAVVLCGCGEGENGRPSSIDSTRAAKNLAQERASSTE